MSYFFENSIHSANYYFKYALGNSALKGEEFHEHDEIVFFLGGKAKFVSKNIQLDLLPKSLIFIPRESFHQFVYENEEEVLERELDGYSEYKKRVKYKLIPFVW